MSLPSVESLIDTLTQALKPYFPTNQPQDQQPIIVGIETGGCWIAKAIHQAISPETDLGRLNISFYRDDFTKSGLHPTVKPSSLPTDIDGKTIILITHKLREIMDITDTVSVMRRGEMTSTVKTSDTSPADLAERMVGRKVLLRVDKVPAKPKNVVLDVRDLNVTDEKGVHRLKGVSFNVRAGEILGIAGVAGNGQSELLEVLGGYAQGSGTILMNGQQIDLTGKSSDGRSRRASGIAHVPEDRQREGLIMPYHAWENVAFGYHHDAAYNSGFLMNNKALREDTEAKIEKFDIRPANCWQEAKNFSGGNQQKIVVAREIERNPDLLLIGQPTRGVDIGAIEFIHQQIVALRDQGKAILLVSVELEEILSLSDRIAVMFDGHIMGERLPNETDEKELGLLMAGMSGKAA